MASVDCDALELFVRSGFIAPPMQPRFSFRAGNCRHLPACLPRPSPRNFSESQLSSSLNTSLVTLNPPRRFYGVCVVHRTCALFTAVVADPPDLPCTTSSPPVNVWPAARRGLLSLPRPDGDVRQAGARVTSTRSAGDHFVAVFFRPVCVGLFVCACVCVRVRNSGILSRRSSEPLLTAHRVSAWRICSDV